MGALGLGTPRMLVPVVRGAPGVVGLPMVALGAPVVVVVVPVGGPNRPPVAPRAGAGVVPGVVVVVVPVFGANKLVVPEAGAAVVETGVVEVLGPNKDPAPEVVPVVPVTPVAPVVAVATAGGLVAVVPANRPGAPVLGAGC